MSILVELWDLYDKNRNKLNKTIIRGNKISEGEFFLVVDVWIITPEKKILITQRHPEKPFGLLWECTGGAVLSGESSIDGAIREVMEEIGLQTKKEQFLLFHSMLDENHFVDTYLLHYDINIQNLKLHPEEVIDAKLVCFTELKEMWVKGEIVPKKRFGLYQNQLENYTK